MNSSPPKTPDQNVSTLLRTIMENATDEAIWNTMSAPCAGLVYGTAARQVYHSVLDGPPQGLYRMLATHPLFVGIA